MHALRIFCFFLCLPLAGQVSKLGRFSSDFISGCAPLTINLTELTETSAQYYYENPNNITNSLTHTYNQPGTYSLVQLSSRNITPNTDTLKIVVHPPTAPQFDYIYCDNREVVVLIDDPTYDSYEVLFAGLHTEIITSGSTTSYAYSPSDPLSISVKGIYNGGANNCAPSTLVLPFVLNNLQPPNVSKAKLNQLCEGEFDLIVEATVLNDVIYQVEWSKDGSTYSLLHEGRMTARMTFEDLPFDAFESEYCVRVNALNRCENEVIYGSPVCTPILPNSLEPIQGLYSTYTGESIAIILNPITAGQIQFSRSFDQISYSNLHRGQSSYTDSSPFRGRQYFYQVAYLDDCNQSWNTQQTQPPFLRAVETTTNHFAVTFDPAVHQSNALFQYVGLLSGESGNEEIPFSGNLFELALSSTLGGLQSFVVKGTANGVTVFSNTINFNYEFIIYVPSAFTPNADGLNDRLEFYGLGGAQVQMKIYNRWGQQVYGEFSSLPSWDGRINGQLAEEGTYVYEISIPDRPNHLQKGTFVLIKN